jgi:hypothetical protein
VPPHGEQTEQNAVEPVAAVGTTAPAEAAAGATASLAVGMGNQAFAAFVGRSRAGARPSAPLRRGLAPSSDALGPELARAVAVRGTALGVLRLTASEQDQAITEQGESGAKGMAASVEVGARSAVGDRNEASAILGIIEANQKPIEKAQSEESDIRDINPAGTNIDTRFLLQQYETSLNIAGGTVSQFDAAYRIAAGDYGRLLGMSQGALKGLGVDPGQSDKPAPQVVTDAISQTKDLRDEVNKVRDTGHSSEGDFKDFNDARKDLVTAAEQIPEEKAAVELAMNDYQAAWLEAQAAAAGATADKAKGELENVKKEIAETAKAVGTAFKIASAVMGNLGAIEAGRAPNMGAMEAAADDIPKELQNKAHTPEDLTKDLKGLLDKVPEIKGFKAADLMDPEKVTEMIGKLANEEKIAALEDKIKNNKELAGLNASAAAAAKGKKPAQILKNRGKKLASMLKTYMTARENLKVATDNLVRQAAKANNPRVAMAFRFLAESEKGVISCKLAIGYGEDEGKRGKEALDKRAELNEGLRTRKGVGGDADKSIQEQPRYYTIKKAKVPGRLFGTNDVWQLTKHDVDLKSSGAQSLNSTPGTRDGADISVADRVAEVKKWLAELERMRSAIAGATGMATPTTRQAQTADSQ